MTARTDITPDEAYPKLKNKLRALKEYATSRSTEFSANPFRDRVLDVYDTLVNFETQLKKAPTVPGLKLYVQQMLGDGANDFIVEVQDTIAALDAAINNILGLFPVSSDGFVKAEKIDRTGRLRQTIPSSSLSGVIADLDAVANGIS